MHDRTHSVGKLGLLYTVLGWDAVCTFGLLTGQDPYDVASMQSAADDLSVYVAALMPSSVLITDWKSYDTNLVEALSRPLTFPAVGTHGTDSGEIAFRSLTSCISGRTKEPTAEDRVEQTRVFFEVLNTLTITAGEKTFFAVDDVAYDNLTQYLNASTVLWGDRSGRKALCFGEVNIQLNAYLQKKRGT